jgi:hypothetical protein
MPISPIVASLGLIIILMLALVISTKTGHKQANHQVQMGKELQQEEIIDNNQISPEILAVISAALVSTMGTSTSYQIKAIKRIDNNLNWKMITRFEQNRFM